MNQIQWKLHGRSDEYRYRLDAARRSIKRALNTGRKFYVSFSGGKDSSALLRLILGDLPDIAVMHIKSGYALPDTDAYINLIRNTWKINLIEIDVPVDYRELCREFGLPHLRSKSIQKKVVTLLKKDTASKWAETQGFTGLFWGLRAEESTGRKALCKCCPNGIVDRHGVLRVAPLAAWTAKDVWAYIVSEGMEYNHLYDKENCGYTRETLRNTGWLSTDGETKGQLEWLRRNYPAQFRKVRDLL